jgi:hypothetical protein
MKKIVLSVLALAAISTVALAERNKELRETDTYFGPYQEFSSLKRLGQGSGVNSVGSGTYSTGATTNALRGIDEQMNDSADSQGIRNRVPMFIVVPGLGNQGGGGPVAR